jgi:hypothetical protein
MTTVVAKKKERDKNPAGFFVFTTQSTEQQTTAIRVKKN